MNIDIFGLGYVGSILIACLSNENKVFGIDVDEAKVEQINKSEPPINEPNLEELLNKNKQNIQARTSFSQNYHRSNIGFICVGTPFKEGLGLDFQYIYRVVDSICIKLSQEKRLDTPYLIVIRSTANSKLISELTEYIEDRYGLIKSKGIILALFPEFLREGSAINDFFDENSISIFSCTNDFKYVEEILGKIFPWNIPKYVECDACSQIKLLSNSWHALKVAFTNETSQILKKAGIDSREAFKIFRTDKKLNISDAYLRPGFSYGGSCLTKDLSGLIALGKENGLKTPLLEGIQKSNDLYIERVSYDIEELNPDNIIFFGITFKANTDDLRASPYLLLAKSLKTKNIVIVDDIISKKIKNNSLSRGNQILLGNLRDCVIASKNLDKKRIINFKNNILVVSHYIYFKFIEKQGLNNQSIINLTHMKCSGNFPKSISYV